MAKSQAKERMRPLTRPLTHVNMINLASGGATLHNELIDTPGYGGDFLIQDADERAACLILDARVSPDMVDNLIGTGAAGWLNTQIQQGDHDADTALLALTDRDIIAYGHVDLVGPVSNQWPMVLQPIQPEPLIITPKFTIAHHGGNSTAINARDIYTVLTYQVVAVPSSVYTDLLLSQQRTS